MSQILYHFTSGHCIEKINHQGLTKGALPWNLHPRTGRPTFRRPFQWLTTNASFTQAWCLLGNLPFPRNAFRVTVCIPATHQGNVISWMDMCLAGNPDCADEINRTGGDVDNWRVFAGCIPPQWIIETLRNPEALLRPENTISQ
jgi:hypothetical protein